MLTSSNYAETYPSPPKPPPKPQELHSPPGDIDARVIVKEDRTTREEEHHSTVKIGGATTSFTQREGQDHHQLEIDDRHHAEIVCGWQIEFQQEQNVAQSRFFYDFMLDCTVARSRSEHAPVAACRCGGAS